VVEFAIFLIFGLEAKHFVADYLLQSPWMIGGKGDIRMAGGYVHAAIHVLGTFLVLMAFSVSITVILAVCVVEFAVHYAIDFGKEHTSKDISAKGQPRRFWALNGLDQFFHHTTYITMTYVLVKFIEI